MTLLRENIDTYERYPFSIPCVRQLEEIHFAKPVTFFVGENGSGKSTLLEAIASACGFSLIGGGRNNRHDVWESAPPLEPYLRLSWMPKLTNGFFLRAESFYEFAVELERLQREGGGDFFGPYGGKSLLEQSHGESFLSLFTNRFSSGKALYLLDEPEAALSPARQLALLRIIRDLTAEGNTQFIIATHSPILLGYPGAAILNFDEAPIAEIAYEQTDHYQITRQFLENRERLLAYLFEDTEEE